MPLPLVAPLVASAAASAAAGLYGSMQASDAASRASKAALEQEQKALDFQKGVWDTTQRNAQPYLEAGKTATGKYQQMADTAVQPSYTYKIPDFKFDTFSDPGAQYQMSQATRALNNSSLAKGLGGGGALKAIMAKNQEMAGTAYQGAFNRYLDKTKMDYQQANDEYKRNLEYQNTGLSRQKDLMTGGANVAAGLGTQATTMADTIGKTYGQLGSSKASGIIGGSNALTQGINTGLNGVSNALGWYYGQQNENNKQTNNNLGDFRTGTGGYA